MRDGLEPVRRESTSALIANQLRAGIMKGLFRPGEQLAEAHLAGQLEVSRGPLREAMQRLVQEGLLRSERNRGLFVVELTLDDVRDIHFAREAVESAAVRALLAGGARPALEELNGIVAQMQAACTSGQWASLADLDLRFHEELVAMAASGRLERMMQTLLVETRICQGALETRYQQSADLVGEHREILAAIAAGDQHKALDLIGAHMADAIERLADGSGQFRDR